MLYIFLLNLLHLRGKHENIAKLIGLVGKLFRLNAKYSDVEGNMTLQLAGQFEELKQVLVGKVNLERTKYFKVTLPGFT